MMSRQQLPHCEAETVTIANPEPVLSNDGRVLDNLLTAEDRYIPSADYFDFQQEIRPFMRKMVAQWMFEVSQVCSVGLLHCTLHYLEAREMCSLFVLLSLNLCTYFL